MDLIFLPQCIQNDFEHPLAQQINIHDILRERPDMVGLSKMVNMSQCRYMDTSRIARKDRLWFLGTTATVYPAC